jgi:multidrug resistance efflux pump
MMSKKRYGALALVLLAGMVYPILADDKRPDKEGLVKKKAEKVVLESKGYIVPVSQGQICPEVRGRVVKLFFEEGTRVKEGDLLASLDDTLFRLEYQRSQAVVNRARARLEELKAGPRAAEKKQAELALMEAEEQRKLVMNDLNRLRRLRQAGAAPAVDAAEVEKLEGQLRLVELRVEAQRATLQMVQEGARREHLDAAKAELEVALAEMAKAKHLLDQTQIRAPRSGTVIVKVVDVGALVDPGAFNLRSSLGDIADLANLEVDLSIQERDIAKVFKGQACKLVPEAYPDRVYEGTVSRLMPIADRAKGAISVRIKVRVPAAEEGLYLKPEMGVVVGFRTKE